jgi:hypothetical protein
MARVGSILPGYGSRESGTTPAASIPGVTPGGILPGYGALPPGLLDQNSANLSAMASGALPQDVIDQIQNHAASFGVANGIPGSQFQGYQGLKNLGLTSLDQSNKATSLLTPFYTSPLQSQQLQLAANQQNQAYANTHISGERPANVIQPQGGQPPAAKPPATPAANTNWLDSILSNNLPNYSPNRYSSPMSPSGYNSGSAPDMFNPATYTGTAFEGMPTTPGSDSWNNYVQGNYGPTAPVRNFSVEDNSPPSYANDWFDASLQDLGIFG